MVDGRGSRNSYGGTQTQDANSLEPIPADLNELFCDVDNVDDDNHNNLGRSETLTKVNSFEYPSQEAKKATLQEPTTKDRTKIDTTNTTTPTPIPADEMDELFRDVNDSTKTKSELQSLDTHTIKVSSSFEYPSKEAKKSDVSIEVVPDGNRDELLCNDNDDDSKKSNNNNNKPRNELLNPPSSSVAFEYPSKEAKKSDASIEKAPTVLDEDMNDFFCDVDDDDDDDDDDKGPKPNSIQPPVTATTIENKSFAYPPKVAKQSDALQEQAPAAQIEENMDELFCDVDDDTEPGAKSIHAATAARGSSFQYPSQEAKDSNASVEKIPTKIDDMDELFCDVDDDNKTKPVTKSKAAKAAATATTFRYPSRDAKAVDASSNKAPAKMEDDMDELFCDVDGSTNSEPKTTAASTFAYPSKEAKTDHTVVSRETLRPLNRKLRSIPVQNTSSDGMGMSNHSTLSGPTRHRSNVRRRTRFESDGDDDDDVIESEDDDDGDDDNDDNDHVAENHSSATPTNYDALSHGVKSRRNRRQSRHNYDSDEDEGESDSDDNDSDQRTRRSSQATAGVTIDTSVYNSVGAVAVYRTGVVSQRPAVLTNVELQRPHYEEIERPPSKEFETSLPMGTDDDAMVEESWIDATVTRMPGSGKKKPNTTVQMDNANNVEKKPDDDDEKSVDLPWYWSPFVWVMLTVLIVALAVIVAVVVVVGGKDSAPEEPTQEPLDLIKAQAFEKYIGSIGDGPAQLEAYQWLTTKDETTLFSETMSEEHVGIMKTRYILAVLFYALGGPKWTNAGNFLDGGFGHCDWTFVDCREIGQEYLPPNILFHPVRGLIIQENNLQGSIPSEITQLTTLEFLLVDGNNLESVKGFENGLDSLRFLVLSDNPLQDHESLFGLRNVETLLLKRTGFWGTLPLEIQQLSNMRHLDLGENELFGSLEGRFQTMSNLQIVGVDDNELTGNLDGILDCGVCTSSLERFWSKGNGLSGNLESLVEFTSLTSLSIAQSKIEGSIPTEFGNLSMLQNLELYQNYDFNVDSSILPSELGQLSILQTLVVSDSIVRGSIPQEFAKLSNLRKLQIARTNISGSIPQAMCTLPVLESIEHSSQVDCLCGSSLCDLVPDSGNIA